MLTMAGVFIGVTLLSLTFLANPSLALAKAIVIGASFALLGSALLFTIASLMILIAMSVREETYESFSASYELGRYYRGLPAEQKKLIEGALGSAIAGSLEKARVSLPLSKKYRLAASVLFGMGIGAFVFALVIITIGLI
jgi:hypothetical protein